MNDNVRKLYDTLSKDGYDTGEFDSFASKIQNPGNLRKLYDVLAADNYDVGEFEGFSNKLFSTPAPDLPDTITMPAESTFVNNPIPAAPVDKNALPRFGDTEGLLSYNQEQVNEEHAKKEAFEKQLDEAIQDNVKKKEADYNKPGIGSYALDAATWLTNPVLGVESMIAKHYIDQPESYRDRRTAGKLLEDAKNMKEMSQAEKEQGDWRRFFSSFGRTIKDEDTLTLGFTEIDNNARLIDVSKKYEKVGFDNLSPSEQELLQAATIKAAAEAYYAHDIGIAQKAGQSTAASIPYMLQFLATSGIGSVASAGVRKALMSTAKHMLKKGVNKELLKIGTSLASNAAKAAAMTPFQPAMYEDITSRLAGNASVVPDKDGRVQFIGMENQAGLGEAIAKGFGSTAIENFSEMSGEYLGGVGRLASKYGKKIPKVGGLIDKAEKNQLLTGFNKFSKDLGWHGTMEEFFEEQVGTGLNALFIGDSKFSDMVDGQQQLATLLSVAAMGGAFVAGNSAVGAPMKRKIRQEYDNAKSLAQDLFGAEEFDKFRMSLSNLPIERRPEFIKKVADAKGFTNEQLMSLGAYAVIQSRYEGYVGGIRDKINEEVVKAQDDMKKVSNPVMGAFVTVTSPLSDKPVNIVGGYLAFTDDGFVDAKNSSQTIYYLDKDGKRQMASPDKFEELNQMVPLEEMYARAMTDVTERIVSEEESLLNSQPFKPNDKVTTPDGFSGMVTEVKADEKIAVVKGQDGTYRDIPLDKLELKQTPGAENTNIPPSEPVNAQQPPADTQQTDASSQPAAEAPKPNFPLTKSGDVDYDRIIDPQMYADALVANFGEEALDTVNELISEENARLEKAQKKANAIDRRLTMKKIKAEIERLGKIQQILSPVEETVTSATEENVAPKQEVVSAVPVPHESLNDREYAEWVLEESENSDELLGAYEIAKESGGERNKLLSWQEELLGKKINPNSFYRFGDRNKVNGSFARAWLKKDGYRIDTYADELSELGVEVTPEDIVDFMLSNPTNYVRKTSDLQKALGKRWAEVATKEAGVPIGNPESATGKVYIAMKKKGGIISPVVYEEAVQEDYFQEDEKMVEDLSGMPVEKKQEDGMRNDEETDWTPEDYQEIYEAIDKELNVSKDEKEGTGFEASDTRAIDSETGREVDTGGDPDGKADYAGEDRTSAGRDSEAGFAPNGRLEADGNVAGVVPEPSVVTSNETPLETIERVAAEQNKRDAVASAEKEVDIHPTEAQKEAGNYKKGHVKVNGFDITIEQPAGSVRSGKDASGKEWSVKMNNTYGYFKGTQGKDGDHIDVFLGSKLGSGKVFVVDQVNPDGSFDEHKVMMGFDSVDEAKTAYLSNYEEGWQGLGNITEIPLDKFKKWVDTGTRKLKPFAEYKQVQETSHIINSETSRSEYKPKEGQPIRFTKWEDGGLGIKDDGQFCFVERVFTESGAFSFTSKKKIKSSNDVAYIFRQLENSSVENTFVAMVKEGKPIVIHLSMGAFDQSVVNLAVIKAAYDSIEPDYIALVHNHPSGKLAASLQDHRALETIKDMFPKGVTVDGIIINTTSGEYATFGLFGNEISKIDEPVGNEIPVKLYSFNKAVFDKDYDPRSTEKIRSSDDVAAFISSQRLGKRKKLSYVILDSSNGIVGNLHTLYTGIEGNENLLANEIVSNVIRWGGVSAIPYGDFILDSAVLKKLNGKILKASGNTVKILDVIQVNGLHTQSASDNGVMEVGEIYQSGTIDNDIRFRERDNSIPEEQAIIGRAKKDGTYMKAPNGNPTNLNEKQWVQVRTKAFKEWFGEWEKAARIEKLRKSKPVEIRGDEITPSDDLKQYKKNALEYGKNLRGQYTNRDTGISISVTGGNSRGGIREILQHDYKDTEHLQSIAAIPQIIENSIFIEELPNEDFQKYSGVKSFSYYVCGLKIGGIDYTVKAIIANQNNGERYYDHKLTEIEKGKLLSIVPTIQKAGIENNSPLSTVKDKRLLSILQTNSSKVVDENGEPLVVYHGTNNYEESKKWNNETRTYDKKYTPFTVFKTQYEEQTGHFFNSDKNNAEGYGSTLYEAFISLKKTLVIDAQGFSYSQIEHNGETKDTYDWAEYAKKNGYDGVIFRNVRDGVDYSDMQFSTDEYVALKSNQIKSATENNGNFSFYSNDIRYRKVESEGLTNQDREDNIAVFTVNERFNEELQQQIEGTLPRGHVYALGKPGVALLSAGIPDLPIELSADRLELKASKEYKSNHPFDLENIKNLPDALNYPIAVFESRKGNGGNIVLTELKQDGNNFVVAIHVRKSDKSRKIDIEVNSIRSLYPKDRVGGIIEWINSGLIRWVDKEKASDFLSTQWPDYIGGGKNIGSPNESTQPNGPITLQADIDSTTKVINSFDNPTFTEGKKIAEVKNLSSELNTPVRIVRDVNDLPEDARKRRAKGYYDPKTGETVIVLPNNTDVADVQKTLLHEIVAHKGLRGLLGDKLDDMLDRVFAGLPEKQRVALAREAYSEYRGNVRVATEEYLARIAEKDIQPTVWEKVKSAIRDFFRSLGIDLRMTDADIKYLLWKSKNRLKRDGSMLEIVENVARDADMKEQLYREDKPEKEKEPLVSPEQLARENPIDQARIVNEALELSGEEKNDFSKKIKHDRFREGWQDRFIPVFRFQELIAKKFGQPIKDFCNTYIFENTIASRSTYEIERYKQMYLRPLLDIVARLGGQDKVADYMKAKHGLERNEAMRARAIERRRAKLESRYEALKESLEKNLSDLENQDGVSQAQINSYTDSIRETLQKEKERMEESMARYEQRQAGTDYSGLTGLQQKLSGEKNALNEGYIRDFVDAFEKDHNVKPLWDAIRKSTRFSLEKQYLSGCIDKKTLDHISGMYEYYIPLREWEEDTAEDFYDYFFKESKDTLNDPLKKTKGRKSEAGDPFANIASMASSAIFIGSKNLMKQHFLRLVTNYKTNLATVSDSWYIYEKDMDGSGVPGWREVRPEFREDMTEEEQQEVAEEFNARMKELQRDGLARTELSGLDLGVPIKPYQAEQHVVKVKENGRDKLIFIQGNPRVAQAINGLNNVRAYDSSLLKAMSNIKQFMTQNFTTRNPTFVARNLSRDMIYAVTMHGIREGGAYTTEFLKAIPGASGAIARYLRGKADMSNEMDKMFNEFLRNGGETGFVALTSYETYKKEIRRMVNKAARTNALADSWEAIGKAFEGCNRWAEDLSRFATYVASRKAGRSVMRSVSDAKEVTVNFNRKGSGAYGGWIGNLCYFFLNAGMQGMHNFGRTFKAHPVKTTFAMTAWAMLGALMPDLISLLYGDDEDYNNIPDHVRQNSIVIPMGGGHYFAVPLSIEVRAFYGIGDIIRQIVKGNYNDRATDAASDIMERLMDLTPRNFIGNSDGGGKGVIGAIASNAVPDVLKPFVEAYVTNSDFTGRAIVKDTEYNKYEPEYQRVYKGTAKELLASSEFINQISGGDYATKGWADSPWLNPAAVEHLFESYFGGVGKTIMQAKKTIASPWTEDFALRNVPVVSGFTYELNPAYPNTAINERYQMYTDLIKEMQSRERMYDKGMMAGEPLDKNYKAFMNSRDWKVAEIAQSYKELIDGIGKEANLAKDKKDKERLYAEITGLKKKMLEQIDNVK